MTRVFSAHAVSVDGFITGRAPGPGRRLGDAGLLFDWYFDGDTGSEVFDGFRLSAESARVFDAEASRVGAVVAGRNTYDDSGWAEGAPRTRTPRWSCSATGRHRRSTTGRPSPPTSPRPWPARSPGTGTWR